MHRFILPLLAAVAFASPATAHGLAAAAGIGAGLAHPLLGADHLLAMLAVGAWAALKGGRAWRAPAAFVAALVPGVLLGMSGVGLPLVEPGILASCIVLGLLLATARRLPEAAGFGLVAVFGLVHGHAHGAELPAAASPFAFAAGLTLASVGLHVLGVGLGTAARRLPRLRLAQAGGLAVAAFGAVGLLTL